MIDRALAFLAAHARNATGLATDTLTLRSARQITDPNTPAGAYVSVVNVSEERALRNVSHIDRTPTQTRTIEPPVHLNLDVLFAFNFADYDTSLTHLSRVIETYQTRRFFDAATPVAPGGPVFPPELQRLVLDMANLTLEEQNNLWGTLGGAYLPSVLYRVRLVEVQGATAVPVSRIETIQLDSSVHDPPLAPGGSS
ncbi:MAG: DUF4255 domain-containing protein [Rhodobacteraceae bacterium]|nr:DUF4255 domain-containing protein [Paracoccaceae bacterium]